MVWHVLIHVRAADEPAVYLPNDWLSSPRKRTFFCRGICDSGSCGAVLIHLFICPNVLLCNLILTHLFANYILIIAKYTRSSTVSPIAACFVYSELLKILI